jgi:hypothetical protein
MVPKKNSRTLHIEIQKSKKSVECLPSKWKSQYHKKQANKKHEGLRTCKLSVKA